MCRDMKMFFPALLACAAFTCSALFTFFCESVQVESNDPNLPVVEFGLYTSKRYYIQEFPQDSYRVKTGCFYFESDISFDSKWKTARAFGCMTVIIGGLAIIASLLGPCFYAFTATTWKALAGLYVVVLPMFQGLTFLILKSELCSKDNRMYDFMNGDYGDCQWNGGSTANVCGITLWFLAGALMLFSGVPTQESPKPAEIQEVTYEKSLNPDGTETITETNVVKGTAVADVEEQAAE